MFKEYKRKTMKKSYIKAMSIIMASLLLIIISGGCGVKHTNKASKEEITVFAASSLTESLEEIVRLFEEENPEVKVRLNVDSTSRLRMQIEQGVEADIFLSANKEHYNALKEQGYVSKGEAFLHNSMTLIVPKANPAHLEKVEDLQNKCKLVLAQREVPAGDYARKIIHSLASVMGAEFEEKVLNNIVSEENNVKQVVNKVVIGEADAAFVYSSDITQSVKEKVKVLSIPEEHNVKAEYWMSKLMRESQSEYTQKFYAFLVSGDRIKIFEKYGFESIK
jgi:molybdate transport system substrate-binding protein